MNTTVAATVLMLLYKSLATAVTLIYKLIHQSLWSVGVRIFSRSLEVRHFVALRGKDVA